MENETTTSDPNPRPSKVPLEHMTKEDLIKQVKRQLILLQKTKHKCDELNERCVTLEKEKNEAVSLHSSEANFKVKITELENKIISITAEKDEAILLHANMQTAQEQHLNKCQEYEKLLEECKLENHQLQESLQKMREKTKDVEKSYQLSEEQLECMKLKLETLTTTCQFLQNDMEKLSSENKVLKNELKIMAEARDEALKSLKSWKEDINKETREVEHLKGEIHFLKIERNELLNKINDIVEVKENLTEKLQSSEEENKIIVEELKSNQKQLEETKMEIENYKLQLEQSNEKTNLAVRIDENDALKISFEKLKQENNALQIDIEELSQEKNNLKAKLESSLLSLENMTKDKEIIIGNLNNIKQENEALKYELQEVKEKMEIFVNEQLSKSFNQISNVEKELLKAHQQNLDLVEELDKVKDLQCFVEDEAKELKEENDKLKTEIKILEADLENDKLHIRKLEKELHAAEEREHVCTTENEKLRIKLHEIENENDLINIEFDNQRKKLNALEEISEKYISIENEKALLESEKTTLLTQIEALKQECNTLKLNNENENLLKENKIDSGSSFDSQEQILTSIDKQFEDNSELIKFKTDNTTLKQEIEQLNIKILEKENLLENMSLVCSNNFDEKETKNLNCEKDTQTEIDNNINQSEKQLSENNYLQNNNNSDKELKHIASEQELHNKIEYLTNECEEIKKSLFSISQEKTFLEKKLEEMKVINRALEENITEANNNKDLFEQKFHEKSDLVENIHCQMDSLLNQIDDLNCQLHEKIKDLETADLKLADEKSKINLLQNELEKYKTELDNLHKEGYHLSDNCPLIEDYKYIKEENEKLKIRSKYLQETNRKLENLIIDLNKIADDKTLVHCEKECLQAKNSEQNNNAELQKTNEEFMETFITNENIIQLENFKEKYLKFKTDNGFLKEENYKLEEKVESLISQLDALQKEVTKLLEEKAAISNDLEDHILMHKEQQISFRNEYQSLEEKCNDLKNQLSEKTVENDMQCKQTEDSNIQTDEVESIEDIKSELSATKDLIKQFSEENAVLYNELDMKSIMIVDKEQHIKSLEDKIFELNQTIDKLLEEKNELLIDVNNKKHESSNQTESYDENIKVLQISLKESDDKMRKIKAVALKTKKELADSKKQLNEITNERNQLKKKMEQLVSEKDKAVSDCRQHLLNFQTLQVEYDKIEDKCEAMNSKLKQFEQDVTQLTSEVTSTKEKLGEIKCENDSLKKSLDATVSDKKQLEQMKTELEGKVIVLESVHETETKKHNETQAELQKKIQKVTELEDQLNMERFQHTSTTQQLEQALKEAKQQNLLSLEMADYERSVSELNANLEERSKCINNLQSQLENEREKYNTALEELKHVECQWKSEESRAKNLKDILNKTKNELSDMKNREQELKDKINSQQNHLESILQKEELFKVQIAEASAENQRLYELVKDLRLNSKKTTKLLETKIENLEEQLKIANLEMVNVKQQFESYKIRVHSVLKQKQEYSPIHTIQDETKQEMENIIEQSREKIEELSEKLKVALTDNEIHQKEHNDLLQHYENLIEEAKLREDSWNQKYSQLKMEHDALYQQQESLSKQLQQQNVITETFKQRLHALQENHEIEIKLLQQQLEVAHTEISHLQKEHQKTSSPSHMPEEPAQFDIFSQERQEGEGSECTDRRSLTPIGNSSLNIIPSSGFISFEQLLQMPDEPDTPTSISSQQDIEKLSSNLVATQKKLEHVTEILNESEANNLRMTEQVRVLKEEIRRLERNKEREDHAENLEYLKNVIIKFVTLEGGDERVRLIPVLTTILRLSPEEQNQLLSVSTGDLPPDNSSGWSSYLHRWSGLI